MVHSTFYYLIIFNKTKIHNRGSFETIVGRISACVVPWWLTKLVCVNLGPKVLHVLYQAHKCHHKVCSEFIYCTKKPLFVIYSPIGHINFLLHVDPVNIKSIVYVILAKIHSHNIGRVMGSDCMMCFSFCIQWRLTFFISVHACQKLHWQQYRSKVIKLDP